MNIFLLLGMLIGFGGVISGFINEGGQMAAIMKLPALLIVLGGTIGIAFIACPIGSIRLIPRALKAILFRRKHKYPQLVDKLCDIANKARKDGLLSLESEANTISNPFIKMGLGYIADGVDPDFLKKVLTNEIESETRKLADAGRVFDSMGGTSPTMGVLGTVMSMTTVLGHMGSDTSKIGTEIAGAFVATLYGIGFANLVWLPLGSHIRMTAEEEENYRNVILEGLLAIQAGESSSRLRDRLYAKIGSIQHGDSNARAEV